jgi:hypothetical protein
MAAIRAPKFTLALASPTPKTPSDWTNTNVSRVGRVSKSQKSKSSSSDSSFRIRRLLHLYFERHHVRQCPSLSFHLRICHLRDLRRYNHPLSLSHRLHPESATSSISIWLKNPLRASIFGSFGALPRCSRISEEVECDFCGGTTTMISRHKNFSANVTVTQTL